MIQKRSDKEYRQQITSSQIESAIDKAREKLYARLEEKGYGTWLSRHEILGFMAEEYYETTMAVHGESLDEVKEELKDMAVGCLFAIACIDAKGLDW